MYRKKRRSWTKHVDFMLLDVLCMQIAFVISYIIRFGTDNPYTDGDYRTLAIAFLFIDFFVEIVSDSFKNVLKRGYFDEFIATCRHLYVFSGECQCEYRKFAVSSIAKDKNTRIFYKICVKCLLYLCVIFGKII